MTITLSKELWKSSLEGGRYKEARLFRHLVFVVNVACWSDVSHTRFFSFLRSSIHSTSRLSSSLNFGFDMNILKVLVCVGAQPDEDGVSFTGVIFEVPNDLESLNFGLTNIEKLIRNHSSKNFG